MIKKLLTIISMNSGPVGGVVFRYLVVSDILSKFEEEISDMSDHYKRTAYVLSRSIEDIIHVYRSPVSGNDSYNTSTIVQ